MESDNSSGDEVDVGKKLALNPPIDKLTTNDEVKAYDAFVNACYHPDPDRAMRHTIREFRKVGITDKQIKRFIGKATAKGIPIPNPNTKEVTIDQKDLERVVLEADSKYAKYGKFQFNEDGPVLQNLADKFGLRLCEQSESV